MYMNRTALEHRSNEKNIEELNNLGPDVIHMKAKASSMGIVQNAHVAATPSARYLLAKVEIGLTAVAISSCESSSALAWKDFRR